MALRTTRLATTGVGFYNDAEWNANGTGSIDETLGSGDTNFVFRNNVGSLDKRLSKTMAALTDAAGSVRELRVRWRINFTSAAIDTGIFMRFNSVDESIDSRSPPVGATNFGPFTVLDAPSATPWTRTVVNATEMGLRSASDTVNSNQNVYDVEWIFAWVSHPQASALDVILPYAPLLAHLGSNLLLRDAIAINRWSCRYGWRKHGHGTRWEDARELLRELRNAAMPRAYAF